MKILSVVERAYRGTIEEQDDTALWFTWTVKKAGASMDVLLRGNAVNYALPGQKFLPLTFGGVSFGNPPAVEEDLAHMKQEGIRLFAVKEDFDARGINTKSLLAGIELLSSRDLPKLFRDYNQIWHW